MIDELMEKIHKNCHNVDEDMVQRAYYFAKEAHKEQKRESGEPYIIHPIAVAENLAELGMDTDTIVAGLLRGLDRSLATEFSFLLALPATFGAGLLGIIQVVKSGSEIAFTAPLLVGVILSAIVGIFAIKFLIKILKKDKLYYFSYYLWIIGIITIISQLFK